ncbi:MAG: chloride channel protein [Deltaproteobacteria bacterium]|nr:chloride channel protein [Deltaproteobacteria bacterium]
MDAPSRRTPTQWTLPRLMGTRWSRTLLLSILVGLLSGLAARALESLVDLGFPRLIGRIANTTAGSLFEFRWGVLLLPVLGGLCSGVIVAFLCRPTRAHGTAVLIDAFHHGGAEMSLRDAALKAFAAAIVISCGGSVGKEAAIAVLCAAIGTTVSHKLGGGVRERRRFLTAGCAAGVGAIFQTPLGGALFAASVLYSEPEFEVEALMPSFIASVTSYSTFMAFGGYGHRLLSGTERLTFSHPLELVPYAVLACLCAAVSFFFSHSLRLAATLRRRSRLPRWSTAAIAGLIGGVIALAFPQIMDARYRFIQGALDGSLGVPPIEGWALCFVLVVLAKCIATALMMGGESAGGLFGPVVFMGGVVGAATGSLFQLFLPGMIPEPLRAALIPVGMAGVLAASLRTPLAAIVMVTEMTGSYGLIVPLMLVSVASYALGHRWGVYAEQVRSPEESPAHAGDSVRSWLESRQVRSLLRDEWPHITHPQAPLPEALTKTPPGLQSILLVTANGELLGFISTAELLSAMELAELDQIVVAADIMNTTTQPLRQNDDLYTALERFRQAGVDVLPVVARDGRMFVGVLERAAMLKELRAQVASRSAAALREHAAFSTLANDVQLDDLLAVLSHRSDDAVVRMRVPEDALGLSLRETDFRQRFGVYVLAIETRDGKLLAPPDPQRPLGKDDVLVVIQKRSGLPVNQVE